MRLRQDVAAQLDDDAHPVLVGEVVDVGNALDPLQLDQFGDMLDEVGLVDLVGQLGDDDGVLAVVHRLDLKLRLHDDAPAPGAIGFARALGAEDQAGGREVGAGNKFRQVVRRGVRVVQRIQARLHDLAQVVRRHAGAHADGDALAAIAEEVREFARHDDRLAVLLIVVGPEIDGVLLDILHHLHGERRHAAFRIPLCGGRIAVDAAEVALGIDQWVAEAEILRHANERRIDRAHRRADGIYP